MAALVFVTAACESELDERGFRRRAEEAYREVNHGWTIVKREEDVTIFVRGDQVDRLPIGEMFADYQASQEDASDWFDAWIEAQEEKAEARRRTLVEAKDEVIPIIKSGKWIRVQDLGAIGPKRVQDQIRPWRKEVATDVYVILGIPEAKLGYRFASIEEVKSSKKDADAWLDRAVENLKRKAGDPLEGAEAMESDEGRLKVLDLPNEDGISALILDEDFREEMLRRFDQPEIGAAVPIRNVLILFDTTNFTTVKPVRARTHQLYDTQNHPGFRGLLRIDKAGLSVLEPANPKTKKRR